MSEGEARPAGRAPTIRDVAERAGVSKSLVSSVLQGKGRVSDASRDAIQQAIDELGYRPNSRARALSRQRSDTVGVIINDLSNPWFVDLLAGDQPHLSCEVFPPKEFARVDEAREVVRDIAPDLPALDVDPVQIQQVLINLIRNGIEAVRGRDERWIRIAAHIEDGRLLFEVEDSGPGIPKEKVRDLFKAFSTSKKQGLGLGLAISRSIAQNHGGDLLVEPGGNGRGATFVLSLPLDIGAESRTE